MKGFLVSITLLLAPLFLSAQNDTLYIKNITIIGRIESIVPNQYVRIYINGSYYKYNIQDISKVRGPNRYKFENVKRMKTLVREEPKQETRTYTRRYRSSSPFFDDEGFWQSPGISVGLSLGYTSTPVIYTQLDYACGYRFNQFLKIGAGISFRYYLNHGLFGFLDSYTEYEDDDGEYGEYRFVIFPTAFPVYFTARGSFIEQNYFGAVPFWSLDIGYLGKGVFYAGTLGVRFGDTDLSYLIGVKYNYCFTDNQLQDATELFNKNISFLGVSFAVEF